MGQQAHHRRALEKLLSGSVHLQLQHNSVELESHLVQLLEAKDLQLLEVVAHPLVVQVRQEVEESQLSLEDQGLQLDPLLEEMHPMQQHLLQLQHQRIRQLLLSHRLEVTGMEWVCLTPLEVHPPDRESLDLHSEEIVDLALELHNHPLSVK